MKLRTKEENNKQLIHSSPIFYMWAVKRFFLIQRGKLFENENANKLLKQEDWDAEKVAKEIESLIAFSNDILTPYITKNQWNILRIYMTYQ